jgi:pimeloyl-ACP methyl ester carboxylesterase/class 3 adenylate cyclase
MLPTTRYAKSGDVHIAYQVFGDGPIDLVYTPGFVSHLENQWDQPDLARWFLRLARFARVVMFDKRGTGLSDRVGELPSFDQRMDDLRAVMDAVGIERAALLGVSEGGPLTALFAATHPDRCRAMVLYGTFARFASWVPTAERLQAMLDYIDQDWGSGGIARRFAPSRQDDPAFRQWMGRFERLGASPAAAMALMRMNSQIDVTEVLPSIRVPTLILHRTADPVVSVEGGRLLAERIPGARYVELPGIDHFAFIGDSTAQIGDLVEEFLTGSRAAVDVDRALATVLFTDIVGSTARAEQLGDQRWRGLLDAHHAAARREFARFRGKEVKSLGDGFLTTFDGPARAIRCASAISEAVRALGIEVRAGLHTGEIEAGEDDVRGIAVHIAARVAALAGPGEVLASRTVRDLVAGSGIRFLERGRHALHGLQEPMELYAAVA